jgi:hypothetical protein
MRIEEMHYDFDVKVDKVDSLAKRNFNVAQKDWLINEAQWVWLKTNYGLTNQTRTGFEMSEHRIQDLKNLHIKSPNPQVGLTPINLGDGTYEINLSSLTFDFLFATRIKATIKKNGCEKTASVQVVQTDDLNYSLIDPFNKPNFNAKEVLAVYGRSSDPVATTKNLYGSGSLFLYTDGTFTIEKVYIEYIKYPNRVWFGTYDLTSDLRPKTGSNTYVYQSGVSTPVHSDLNAHTHSEIIDLAVLLASQLIEDPNLIQLKRLTYQTNK